MFIPHIEVPEEFAHLYKKEKKVKSKKEKDDEGFTVV